MISQAVVSIYGMYISGYDHYLHLWIISRSGNDITCLKLINTHRDMRNQMQYHYTNERMLSGLGRVQEVRVRVQVRALVICVSTSTSPSTWLLHEYKSKYEYWLMSTNTSTSTGLWSTFYRACIGSRFLLFGLWQESPQIPTNLGQSSNCPLSM